MATKTLAKSGTTSPVFPGTEVKRRLLIELKKIADQGSVLRPEWEPLLDSKRVVGAILVLDDLFPFKIPPDKVVRKGGYDTEDKALNDILDRIKKIWLEKSKPKVHK